MQFGVRVEFQPFQLPRCSPGLGLRQKGCYRASAFASSISGRPRFVRCCAEERPSEAKKAQGQARPVYIGEEADNLEIQEALTKISEEEILLDEDDSDEEGKDDHGLEELGIAFVGDLNPTQEKYKEKLAAKLRKDQEEERLSREARSGLFDMAKAAYTSGRYPQSVTLFEEASEAEGTMSALGGDILMWLALAYQATGNDEKCIATYQSVEDHHPLRKVRNQAANLRFICQAPKLKRGPDEKVAIPVLKIEDRKKQGQRSNYRRPVPTAAIVKRELTLEERFWAEYKAPTWTRNRYVWWAAGVLGVSLAVYSALFVDVT